VGAWSPYHLQLIIFSVSLCIESAKLGAIVTIEFVDDCDKKAEAAEIKYLLLPKQHPCGAELLKE
jgi:hypothetical protein